MSRFNFELPDFTYGEMAHIRDVTAATSKAEVVRDAITIYKSLVEGASAGDRLFIGLTRHDAREIVIPALDRIRRRVEQESEVLSAEDLRVEVYRGAYVNKGETGVKVMHIPSGLSASSDTEKSRHRNKAVAIKRLREKLKESKWEPTSKPT